MTEEQHAQVVQDNLRLIEINHDLRLDLDTCKKAIGKCNSEATELHSIACAHERSGDAFMPIWWVKKRAKDIKLACAETFAEPEEVKPEDMTTCSAYDLISEEDRETLRWVKDQGGLQVIKKLADVCDMLRKRAMPEGYEWPRYEDGEMVTLGDNDSLEFYKNGLTYWHGSKLDPEHDHLAYGERVKRPQVLAADGEPLEVGQTVFYVDDGEEFEVVNVSGELPLLKFGETAYTAIEPEQLTHQRPVLDADGSLIKVGDTVWNTNGGGPFKVEKVSGDNVEFTANCLDGPLHWGFKAHELTHTKPEFDHYDMADRGK